MSDRQLSLFDLLEDKRQRDTFTLPDMWTISQLCDKYYKFKQTDGCSCSFLNSASRHLQYFISWLKRFGFDPDVERLSDINSAILSDYRQMLAENTKIGAVTANVYIAHVRMLFFWAENMHGLRRPPMGMIRKFRKNKAKIGHGRKQDRSALSWDELSRLFAVANATDTALLLLGLNCGFGNNDIATLKMCDINLKEATVSHPRQKTGIQRNFSLWPQTVEVLWAYIKYYRGKPVNEKVGELVFVGRTGNPMCWERFDEDGKFRRSDAIKNRFLRLYERARLKRPYGRGYYSIRHTAATLAGLCTNDPSQIQALLGHSNPNTQIFYRHDSEIKARQAQQGIYNQLEQTIIPEIISKRCA